MLINCDLSHSLCLLIIIVTTRREDVGGWMVCVAYSVDWMEPHLSSLWDVRNKQFLYARHVPQDIWMESTKKSRGGQQEGTQ